MNLTKSSSKLDENELFAEVANILDKERTLYQLKIHQEKQQASEWREKYNQLRSRWMKEATQCPESLTQANLLQALADLEVNHEWDDELFEDFDSELDDREENLDDINDKTLIKTRTLKEKEVQFTSTAHFDDEDWRYSIEDPRGSPLVPENFSSLVLSKSKGQFLDLSNLNLTQQLFILLIRKIFPSRLPISTDEKNLFQTPPDYPLKTFIRVISLYQTTLTPSFIPPLCYCLRAPLLLGIDLSSTNLSDEILDRIIEVLRGRKSTPCYILLNKNLELSYGLQNPLSLNKKISEKKQKNSVNSKLSTKNSHSNSFTSHHILHVLSNSTWGIGVSFADYHQAPRILSDQVLESKGKKGSTESNLAYKEVIKPPMRAKAFIELLIQKLKGESENTFSILQGTSQSKTSTMNRTKSISKKSSNGVGKNSNIPIREIDPISDIKVLSITDCTLSLASINLFPSLFNLIKDTLFDLDLSFSSIGNYGIKKISQLIKDSEMLIRLELRGNEIDDYGVFDLCQELTFNKSIIHIGLGSNRLSGVSVTLLLKLISKKKNISTIDLRGNNNIHPFIIQNANKYLEDISSFGNFIWDSDDFSTPTDTSYQPLPVTNDEFLDSLIRYEQKLYFKPIVKRNIVKVSKVKSLCTSHCATISTHKILSQPNFVKNITNNFYLHPQDTKIDGFIVSWFMRPIPFSSFSNTTKEWMNIYNKYFSSFGSDKTKQNFPQRDAFYSIPSKIKLMWEIRIVLSNKIISKYRVDVSSSFESNHPFFSTNIQDKFNLDQNQCNKFDNLYEKEQIDSLHSIYEFFPDNFQSGKNFSISKDEAITYLSSHLPWVSCSAIIPFIPPINSSIQIKLFAISNTFSSIEENVSLYDEDLSIHYQENTEEFVGIESKLLTITPFYRKESFYLGGDNDHNIDIGDCNNRQPLYTSINNFIYSNEEMFDLINELALPFFEEFKFDFQSIYFSKTFPTVSLIKFLKDRNWKQQFIYQDKLMTLIDYNEAPMPISVSKFFSNQNLLRCFLWSKGTKGLITWQSKLLLNEKNSKDTLGVNNEGNELNVSYEWSVIRVSKDQLYPPVVLKIGDHTSNTNNNSNNILDVWKYKKFEVILEDLSPCDIIFVTYRICHDDRSNTSYKLSFNNFEVRIIPDSDIFTSIKETNYLIPGIVTEPLNVYTLPF